MGSYKDMIIYKKAFGLAMDIFEISKRFPKEETYSLMTKYEEVQDLFVPTLPKHIEEGNILLTL